MLGVIFCIMIEFLGIEMIFKNKIKDEDTVEQKETKKNIKKTGFFLLIYWIIFICFFIMYELYRQRNRVRCAKLNSVINKIAVNVVE